MNGKWILKIKEQIYYASVMLKELIYGKEHACKFPLISTLRNGQNSKGLNCKKNNFHLWNKNRFISYYTLQIIVYIPAKQIT